MFFAYKPPPLRIRFRRGCAQETAFRASMARCVNSASLGVSSSVHIVSRGLEQNFVGLPDRCLRLSPREPEGAALAARG